MAQAIYRVVAHEDNSLQFPWTSFCHQQLTLKLPAGQLLTKMRDKISSGPLISISVHSGSAFAQVAQYTKTGPRNRECWAAEGCKERDAKRHL